MIIEGRFRRVKRSTYSRPGGTLPEMRCQRVVTGLQTLSALPTRGIS